MQNFDFNAAGETLSGGQFTLGCNSEELYEIGGGINYEVGSKIVPGVFDCRKPPSYMPCV